MCLTVVSQNWAANLGLFARGLSVASSLAEEQETADHKTTDVAVTACLIAVQAFAANSIAGDQAADCIAAEELAARCTPAVWWSAG